MNTGRLSGKIRSIKKTGEYGDEEEAAKFAAECAALGFETVSMRDEFETIYAEGVRMEEADGEAEAAFVREPYTEGSGHEETV